MWTRFHGFLLCRSLSGRNLRTSMFGKVRLCKQRWGKGLFINNVIPPPPPDMLTPYTPADKKNMWQKCFTWMFLTQENENVKIWSHLGLACYIAQPIRPNSTQIVPFYTCFGLSWCAHYFSPNDQFHLCIIKFHPHFFVPEKWCRPICIAPKVSIPYPWSIPNFTLSCQWPT